MVTRITPVVRFATKVPLKLVFVETLMLVVPVGAALGVTVVLPPKTTLVFGYVPRAWRGIACAGVTPSAPKVNASITISEKVLTSVCDFGLLFFFQIGIKRREGWCTVVSYLIRWQSWVDPKQKLVTLPQP